MTFDHRQSTGVPGLDELLGGGLLPGTLTVVVGATGIGKTQLGLQFAHAGAGQSGERRTGVVFDVSARGDSQHHRQYAQRMFDWTLHAVAGQDRIDLSDFFAAQRRHGDYLHVFDYRGRRVTRRDVDWDQWRSWQAELNAKLTSAIAFLYAEAAAEHDYDPQRIGCLMLATGRDTMLDELISRPLDEGDSLSNANTLIYMGKIREGHRLRRALYIAKHRGSPCSEEIHPYTIDQRGLSLQ